MSTIQKRWWSAVSFAIAVAFLVGLALPVTGQESPGFMAANGRVSFRLY